MVNFLFGMIAGIAVCLVILGVGASLTARDRFRVPRSAPLRSRTAERRRGLKVVS